MCYLVYDIILYHFDTTIFCVRASIALAASANGADAPTRAQKKPSPGWEGGVKGPVEMRSTGRAVVPFHFVLTNPTFLYTFCSVRFAMRAAASAPCCM